jgi:predicted negative regulator of RcsB-dependent stress response
MSMAYDLEEQEQLDIFKTWWKANGDKAMSILTVVLVGFLGFQGWQYYQGQQSKQASAKYETLMQLDSKNTKAIQSVSAELMEKYSSTPYAGRAALAVAKANYEAKDAKSAKAQLEWATKNAKEDSIIALALLQLAAIQFEEKNYDAALKTLAEKHDAGFEGLFADLKGDILVTQGKKAEAKQAYQHALTNLDAHGRYYGYTAHKLEALGS